MEKSSEGCEEGLGQANKSTSSLTSLCCQLLKLHWVACFMMKNVGPEY